MLVVCYRGPLHWQNAALLGWILTSLMRASRLTPSDCSNIGECVASPTRHTHSNMGELWLVSGTGFTRVIPLYTHFQHFGVYFGMFWLYPTKKSWDFKKAGDSRLKTRGELRNLDHLRGGSQIFGMWLLVILLFIPHSPPIQSKWIFNDIPDLCSFVLGHVFIQYRDVHGNSEVSQTVKPSWTTSLAKKLQRSKSLAALAQRWKPLQT